jgi:hypothetical protein
VLAGGRSTPREAYGEDIANSLPLAKTNRWFTRGIFGQQAFCEQWRSRPDNVCCNKSYVMQAGLARGYAMR